MELTTVARHDPAHCLIPGVFQTRKRGRRKGHNLDVSYRFNKTTSVRFIGFEPLGADDMRVMQGALAIAGAESRAKTIDLDGQQSEIGKQLALLLEPKLEAVKQEAVAIRTTWRRLAREMGVGDGGQNFKDMEASLLRLSNVTAIIERDGWKWSCHLSSYAVHTDGRLCISLNPRVSDAMLGRSQYTHIDMREVRAKLSDFTRILHQRLCAIVDPGQVQTVGLGTMINYVWPDLARPANVRKRRERIRKAMAELAATRGWYFTPQGDGNISIRRANRGYESQKQ